MPGVAELIGPVTVVTGLGRGSGKTTLVDLALPVARRAGPVAVFTVGVHAPAPGAPRLVLAPGDLTLTTEPLARAADARLEILDALPGRSALGRLLLGRAVRGGEVAMVGPEHLSTLAGVVEAVRDAGWAARVLVDGAVSRLTQASALGDHRFVQTASVTPATLMGTVRRLRALEALAELPVASGPPPGGVRLDGPLTATVLEDFGPRPPALSLADLTQCFLDPDATLRLLDGGGVSVRRRIDLRGTAVRLRDVTRDAFAAALGRPPGVRYLFDPAQVRPC